ncbi:hypothetical protein M501DRAFT_1028668 [Patellaria atrata CBS 101060]|uniref:C2 domain-containing protein n=1 Tax=Patellaria atrata CBS 101060 TaxID=1346257 RepID=A0A9P4SGB6_9PEZI|nr:hypothetical protein M501DRAFT_1028668 [Patellaria atrata CBS 101060]
MANKMFKPSAGIYADLTVDGPEIGSLILVIYKAKNLRNLKTMGKQNVYCAARLGKEAKKTGIHQRGGQNPQWEQEPKSGGTPTNPLQFTVRDSADYRNLYLACYKDDRKTELIGDATIDLNPDVSEEPEEEQERAKQRVLVPGGRKIKYGFDIKFKDQKGNEHYGGTVFIEMTYHDTRVQPEKPTAKRKEHSRTTQEDFQGTVGGPRQLTPVKRRPLPADPTVPSHARNSEQDHVQSSSVPQTRQRDFENTPRPQPESYPQSTEHIPSKSRRSIYGDGHSQQSEQKRVIPDHSTAQQSRNSPQPRRSHHQHSHYETHSPVLDSYPNEETRVHSGYKNPRDRVTEHVPPYHNSTSSFPQREDENRPVAGQRSSTVQYQQSRPAYRPSESYSNAPSLPHSYSAPDVGHRDVFQEPIYDRSGYHNRHQEDRGHEQDQSDDHSYQSSPHQQYSSSGMPVDPNRHTYYEKEPEDYSQPSQEPYSRYNPYNDPSYDRVSALRLQPTVEDENPVPPPPPAHRSGASIIPYESHHRPNDDMTVAPLNIARSREVLRHHYENSPREYSQHFDSHPPGSQSTDHRLVRQTMQNSYEDFPRPSSRDDMVPSPLKEHYGTPLSLVPGYNPRDPQESHRRMSRTSISAALPPSPSPAYQPPVYEPPPNYDTSPQRDPVLRYSQLTIEGPPGYSTPPQYLQEREEEIAPMIKPRAVSPVVAPRESRTAHRSMPSRKSVSPRPGSTDGRNLSSTPFSPDSFDTFNPNIRSNSASNSGSSYIPNSADERSPRLPYEVPSGKSSVSLSDDKIVGFDGRVIDPSDHLPTETWAPEPEVKGKSKPTPVRDREKLTGAREPGSRALVRFGGRERESFHEIEREREDRIISSVSSTVHSGRNKLQKRNGQTTDSSPVYQTSSQPLRERQNPSGYSTGSPGYVRAGGAPPIPAKVPLDRGSEDMMALSKELSGIEIGTVGRRGNRRSRYG